MDNYLKVKTIPPKNIISHEPWDVYVSSGCKFKSVIQHCLKVLKDKSKICVTGSGSQISKAISVCEIVKRRSKSLEQNSELFYIPSFDIWEPKDKDMGLDSLKVTSNIPAIRVTLTKTDGNGKVVNLDVSKLNKELIGDLKTEFKHVTQTKKKYEKTSQTKNGNKSK